MQPAPARWTVRVYYEDTDAGGVVYYANYLKFFERARTEWLRAAGIGQHALVERDGIQFMVTEARLRFLAPARLDDLLELELAIVERGGASLVFEQQARRDGDLLASARVRVACVDRARLRPTRMPPAVAARLAPYTTPHP